MMWASPIARFVGCRHTQASVGLRKAVQIIVMAVTVVTLPVFIELLGDAACTLSRDRHVIFGTGAVGMSVMDELIRRGRRRVWMVNCSGRASVPPGVEVLGG